MIPFTNSTHLQIANSHSEKLFMASIFTKIIQNILPAEKVYETESEIAFLDIAPVSSGHTLVVPKHEVALLEDLPTEEAICLMQTLQKVAKAISDAYEQTHYNILLNNGADAGQEVPHLHFHIIPRAVDSVWNFSQKVKYGEGELQKVGDLIRSQLARAERASCSEWKR